MLGEIRISKKKLYLRKYMKHNFMDVDDNGITEDVFMCPKCTIKQLKL